MHWKPSLLYISDTIFLISSFEEKKLLHMPFFQQQKSGGVLVKSGGFLVKGGGVLVKSGGVKLVGGILVVGVF
jgi:hypothetical protein